MLFSAQPFPDADFELDWLRPDGTGNAFPGRFEIEGEIQAMEGWLCPALKADLNTLRQELTEMHAEARTAAAQRSREWHNDQGGGVSSPRAIVPSKAKFADPDLILQLPATLFGLPKGAAAATYTSDSPESAARTAGTECSWPSPAANAAYVPVTIRQAARHQNSQTIRPKQQELPLFEGIGGENGKKLRDGCIFVRRSLQFLSIPRGQATITIYRNTRRH